MRKNKVILVNPGIHFHRRPDYGLYPNTAIMILATILDRAGFQVKVIDSTYLDIGDATKAILSEIDENLAFVGFSVMTIQLPWSYFVSRAIKAKFPDAAVAWGGVHPTLFPEQTVEDPAVDIAVVNDAAATIVKLGETISRGDDLSCVPGIFYKTGRRIKANEENKCKDDFSNTPFIDFSLLDHERYSRRNSVAIEDFYSGQYKDTRAYPIVTALGCPYQCTFCINVIVRKKCCFREAGEIVERIKFLKSNYGADFIQPLDENFFVDRKRTFEFLDLLEKENLNIKWRPQTRADYFSDNYVDFETVKRLSRSGMVVAAMGVESASQSMLDKLKKNLKVEQIIKAAEMLSRANIIPKMNFMVGLPGETERDIENTYRLALKIRNMVKISCVSVTPFRPYPGSPLYKEIVDNYGYSPPRSLKEWAKLSEREFVDSFGYESFDNYKWIDNPRRLNAMVYAYRQIAFYNPSFKGRIREIVSSFRMRFNFFLFISLERAVFEKLSKIKGFIIKRLS